MRCAFNSIRGIGTAVILGRIGLHPLADRPDLLLLFSFPRFIHGLSVFLPGGNVSERLEHAGHRHAGEKMRGLVRSRELGKSLSRIDGLSQTGISSADHE